MAAVSQVCQKQGAELEDLSDIVVMHAASVHEPSAHEPSVHESSVHEPDHLTRKPSREVTSSDLGKSRIVGPDPLIATLTAGPEEKISSSASVLSPSWISGLLFVLPFLQQ